MRIEDSNQNNLYAQTQNANNQTSNTRNNAPQTTNNQNAGNQFVINDMIQAIQNAQIAQASAVYERALEASQSSTVTTTDTVSEASRIAATENPATVRDSTAITPTNYSASAANTTAYAYPSVEIENAEAQISETENIEVSAQEVNEIPTPAEMQAQNTTFLIQQNFQIQANHSEVAENTRSDSSSIYQSGNTAGLWGSGQSTAQSQSSALISEDGFWGVEQTSQRIFDLAASIADGDPDRMNDMRDAVSRGFEAAGGRSGGQLPQISQQTYEAVMQNFDNWGLV